MLGCGIEFLCYQWTVNVLSDHPRWIFKKNSMEFFIGLQPYLYYYYSGCTLKSHDHMFFPECSMITWPCHMILTYWVPFLYPYSIVCFEVLDQVFKCRGNLFPVWGSHNRSVGRYYITNVTHHSHMSGCHSIMSHDECGKVVYRPCSSCISSI